MSATDSSSYDVFISAKSEDYPHATIAAKYLQDAGLRVFFSLHELPNMGNSDYFSAIDDALEFSRHMLVVTSSRQNATSQWVKKEWQTFLNEKLSGRKTGNVVTLLCDGMTIADLPLSLRQHEARSSQDLASLLNYFKSPFSPKTTESPVTSASRGRDAVLAPPISPPVPAREPVPSLAPASPRKPSTSHDVFICHATKDQNVASATCAWLERHGIRCWIAPRDILPGGVWASAIIEAIGSARVMVLIFSSHANASQQVMREVERAVNVGLTLIPMRVEDVQPKSDFNYFLGPHWFDAFTPPLEEHLDKLAAAIRSLLQ